MERGGDLNLCFIFLIYLWFGHNNDDMIITSSADFGLRVWEEWKGTGDLGSTGNTAHLLACLITYCLYIPFGYLYVVHCYTCPYKACLVWHLTSFNSANLCSCSICDSFEHRRHVDV